MEFAGGKRDVVDPDVRAYVSSLVTALGGSGADEDGKYVLGDDALAVLRDIKRWLKLYDEKANRLDVARCLAETNLVNGDLLQILASWPEHETDNRIKAKVALSCLEVLVPLTWPLDRVVTEMTVNHHRHTPYLQRAQIGYKRSIINFDGSRILYTAVRIALPSMAEIQSERSTRDVGIIKLVLYFLRNIAMIAPPLNTEYDGDEAEISRSATIDAFDYQEIFHVLLTLASTMGDDFSLQDVVVMEIIFHLIKGVDVEKMFMSKKELDDSNINELVSLRNQEAGMKRQYERTQPTRHNRFGTMVWVQREDAKMSTVSGQDALINGQRTLAKMDNAKKFKPPRRSQKTNDGPLDFDTPVPLGPRASKNLRAFVEEFLDSGFNALFHHVRKAIDREAERVQYFHSRQFFYLVAWFLQAQRARRKAQKSAKPKEGEAAEDADGFGLVASVLNHEMFSTLNRAMDMAYQNNAWQDLNAAMRCFTQILLTVQEMSESPLDEDQEIAENILNNIFYEETTHDRVANIIRYYKDQGFGYLDACTELAHNYIRILENYSKQNADLVVRSKRRARRVKKAAKEAGETGLDDDDVDESDPEQEARAEKVSSERKFDFKRFAARFLTQGCIDTFVTFCGYYRDLNPEQLKRAHRYFYRVAFKMEMSVMLFRVDIIALFHKMIRGPEGMISNSPVFKEWDELIRQLLKRCTRKMEERPQLIIEMLFSKTNSIAHYLEYGYEKQVASANPRAAAELEVKPGMDWEKQIAVVVTALLQKTQAHHLDWVTARLGFAQVERQTWESANRALESLEDDAHVEDIDEVEPKPANNAPIIFLTPDNDEHRMAMFKNGHLRLLMTLIGWQRLVVSDEEDPNSSWIIPSLLTSEKLGQTLSIIKATEFDPLVFEDGSTAEDHIRRKSIVRPPKKREAFDDEDENDLIDDDEELFPPGGPTNRKDALAALKKTRHRRHKSGSEELDEDSEERRREREKERLAREREKLRKIKSDLYVHDSDDEDDEERDKEFFAKEKALRDRQAAALKGGLVGLSKKDLVGEGAKKRTRALLEDSEDEAGVEEDESSPHTLKRDSLEDSDEDASQDEDTPPSSINIKSSRAKRRRISAGSDSEDGEGSGGEGDNGSGSEDGIPVPDLAVAKEMAVADMDEDEEDDVPVGRPVRRRKLGGFMLDSSDEE